MTTDTQPNISEENALLFSMFDEWTNSLIANGKEDEHQRKEFARVWRVKENSPIALMYSAFLGGIGAGIKLAKLDKEE